MYSWLGDPTNEVGVALIILAATLVPVCARIAALHARSRNNPGERQTRLLKAEGQQVRCVAGGMESRDRSEQRQADIRRVRQERAVAVRRRRAAAVSLIVISVMLLVSSFLIGFAWWFALLPLVALAVVLVEGIVSAGRARRFERQVAAQRHAAASRAHKSVGVTGAVLPGRPGPTRVSDAARVASVQGPQSRPIRSVRQVAHAVPLEGEDLRRVLADVTPSVPVPVQEGKPQEKVKKQDADSSCHAADGTDHTAGASGTSASDTGACETVAHGTGLAVDVSDILSRRQG